MNKKALTAGIAALFLGVALVPQTLAFGGDGQGVRSGGQGQGFKLDPEVRIEIQEAMQSGDYDAFVAAHPEGLDPKLTEVEFDQMVERRAEMEAHKEAVKEALDNGDYDVWKTLVEEYNPDAPVLEIITADNFTKFVELHQLKDQARELSEELGLGKGFGEGQKRGGHGQGKGMQKGGLGQGRGIHLGQ